MLRVLTEVFQNIQFIVTTNSPFIIGSVKGECIAALENGEARHIGFEPYGMTVNDISNSVMEIRERLPRIAELFSGFYEKISNNDMGGASVMARLYLA